MSIKFCCSEEEEADLDKVFIQFDFKGGRSRVSLLRQLRQLRLRQRQLRQLRLRLRQLQLNYKGMVTIKTKDTSRVGVPTKPTQIDARHKSCK